MGELNLHDWKMQDCKVTNNIAGVEIAGLKNDGRSRRDGNCRTGQ